MTKSRLTPLTQSEQKVAARVRRVLTHIDVLPDDALIEIGVVSIVLGRSNASIWRDVEKGRLASPYRTGARSTRWRLGDVRAAMKGGRDVA